ncbi:diacylglycerol kinase [Legionella maioricensis]|uniref:Diacylglycerol kinase n=1 Tax=Legionella maioricensis TaxID=2896528 RepID=A0A9X2IAP0_9GAMM|nr:diacylglycerol kinase [Legionella maioricensis]MCL9683765.1 diacylglycerol kinase [Legionella maioricensis]MCL9686612.1 diacylglycerol kinase [Legionella maioricensis]
MVQSTLRLYKAFKNSWQGLKNAWRFQWAFRVEVGLFLIALPSAFYIGKNAVEYVLLLSSVLLILIMELINSAIETTVNRIGLEYHELSGLAKDLASSSILVSILNALITWGIILLH